MLSYYTDAENSEINDCGFCDARFAAGFIHLFHQITEAVFRKTCGVVRVITYFLSRTSVSIMSATTFPTLRLSCLSTYCFDVASLDVVGVGRLLIDFVPMSSGPVIVPPERGSLVAIEPAVEETTLEMEESTYVFVAASPPNSGSFRFVIEL